MTEPAADPCPWMPETEPRLSPSLAMFDACAAIEFYKEVFDAEELVRFQRPDGFIDHAQLAIGASRLMITSYDPNLNANPAGQEQASVQMHLFVEDAHATMQRALERGATERIPVSDQFYGYRTGRFQDPFGHVWVIATQIEDLGVEEMKRRYDELMDALTG